MPPQTPPTPSRPRTGRSLRRRNGARSLLALRNASNACAAAHEANGRTTVHLGSCISHARGLPSPTYAVQDVGHQVEQADGDHQAARFGAGWALSWRLLVFVRALVHGGGGSVASPAVPPLQRREAEHGDVLDPRQRLHPAVGNVLRGGSSTWMSSASRVCHHLKRRKHGSLRRF